MQYSSPPFVLHAPPISSMIFIISTLFSDVLNLRFSFRVRDQVLYPYKITGKIRFEVFREVKMWIVVFWIVETGIHAGGFQRF
jgi:hypothetical protein